MIHLTQNSFKQEIEQYKGIVLADFYADWCGPCRILSPIIEEIANENKDTNVKIVKINVDENRELAMQFSVMSIPTIILFKDGKPIGQSVGVAPKDMYVEAIQKAKKLD